MKAFPALLTRERWEHPALWMVPGGFALFVVGAALVGFISGVWNLGFPAEEIRMGFGHVAELTTAERRGALRVFLMGLAVPFNVFLLALMFFYALGSLYDDRRDRSILFWKSLPVSDLETVVSKLVAATVLAPALTFVVVAALHVVALVTVAVVGAAAGADGWYRALDPVVLGHAWLTIAWLLLAQSLILLPIVAWVMLASAWARKAPFLWAVVPPVAVVMIEEWFTRDSMLLYWISRRFTEGFPKSLHISGDGFRIGTMHGNIDVDGALVMRFDLLWSFELWSGVAIAAVLLAGAVWLRRHRADAE